jgi:transcriptional regulator with GAF, ATPase, and Fis domain
MGAKLVVLAGPRCGETFSIDAAETTIGRDASSQLSIPDHLISRRHCAVELSDDRCTLRDLGSSNGTYVNGMPVRERTLTHGDRIRAGDSVLLFLKAGADSSESVPGAESLRAMDDRTQRIARVDTNDRPPDPPAAASAPSALRRASPKRPDPSEERWRDTPEAIVAEVLAGRMTLQAHDMVGESAPMRAVYECIRKVAPRDSTVLICGETGTGKELAARAVHQNSPRASRPFLAVNCAALTESLLESELFGHEKGAFTGAVVLKKGKFEVADGGTIFLDEIGELAPALQAKLLRALQHHEFERVGGTRAITVNVRLIAATNQDLQAAVAAGRFRQDLWYRLNVVGLTMPPLRARRADIPMLAAHFAAKYGRGRAIELSRDALDALRAYDWPGNVRELENAIERAVVLGYSDRIVADDLPETVLESSSATRPREGTAYHQTVLDVKRRLILDAIDRSGGNYTAAARLLGINPTYLHRLVNNLQLRDTAAPHG